MSPKPAEPDSVACGSCEHVFEDHSAAIADPLLPCSKCGSGARAYRSSVTVTITTRIGFKAKARRGRPGEVKPFQEGQMGPDLYSKTGVWNDVQRNIDHDNDWYDEVIRDPTGNIIREVHEPLSEHTGRGSARRGKASGK